MIGVLFEFAGDYAEVRVDGTNVLFRGNPKTGFGTIENLQLNRTGVIMEFPDLENDDDWRKEAIRRFKQKIKSYKTEMERINYIIEDLKKHGYIAVGIQRDGFRLVKLK